MKIVSTKTVKKSVFALVVALTMLISPKLFAEGGDNGPGNGGDACELRIQNIREDLKKWIADGGATHLKLPAKLETSAYNKTMLDAIADAEVSCTSDKLTLKGVEKTCLNSVGGVVKIICNSESFSKTSESEQYMLIHHEYAGIAGIEVNTGLASDYTVSRQLVSFLKDTVVKKLVVPSDKLVSGPVEDMQFAPIKAGKFWMGSCSQKDVVNKRGHCIQADANHQEDETLHEVTLANDFEIMTTEVTQKQWFLVMGSNPSYFKTKYHCSGTHTVIDDVEMCPNHPVENISWNDAKAFLRVLNRLKKDSYHYRLPTEAEWEYSAKTAENTDPIKEGMLNDYAWYVVNSENTTHAVASKKGIKIYPDSDHKLYDMYGSVTEWVSDLYEKDLGSVQITNPTGPLSGLKRVARGCDFRCNASHMRPALRSSYEPFYQNYFIGFRLVRQK